MRVTVAYLIYAAFMQKWILRNDNIKPGLIFATKKFTYANRLHKTKCYYPMDFIITEQILIPKIYSDICIHMYI